MYTLVPAGGGVVGRQPTHLVRGRDHKIRVLEEVCCARIKPAFQLPTMGLQLRSFGMKTMLAATDYLGVTGQPGTVFMAA